MSIHKGYPRYQKSDLHWIKEIPEHWVVKKLKTFSNVQTSNVDKKTVEDEIPVLLCNYVDVYYNDKINYKLNFMKATAKEEQIRKFTLNKNDVLITKDSESPIDIAVPTWVEEDLEGVLCGYHLSLIRPNSNDMNGRYLYYSFETSGIKEQFWVKANGVTRFGLSKDSINNGLFIVPPIDEQNHIVDFLDNKTFEIDSLIADKEKFTELLEEKRQVVITEAVTKGLNPSVKMKKSLIEWIEEIPVHWKEQKIKYLFYEKNERNFDENAELLSLFTSIGVKPRSMMEEKGNKAQTVINYKEVQKGDIIVNKLLAWMGAIAMSDYEGVTSPDYDVYSPINEGVVHNKFYHYYFRNPYFKGDCYKYGRGIMLMRWRTYPDQFKTIVVPVPPIDEQIEICNYINEINQNIEELLEENREVIAKLKEYRQSLIYEAVTGKIDVRDYAEAVVS